MKGTVVGLVIMPAEEEKKGLTGSVLGKTAGFGLPITPKECTSLESSSSMASAPQPMPPALSVALRPTISFEAKIEGRIEGII